MSKESRKTRAEETRDLVWSPPNKLDVPEAPEGFKYRWVRRELMGDEEDANVYRRMREHYTVVRADEVPGWECDQHREGRYAGVVRSGDLILMKVPIHVAEQRNAYYEKQARLMQQAVDMELDKEGTSEMPIQREVKSTVTRGRRPDKNATFDED